MEWMLDRARDSCRALVDHLSADFVMCHELCIQDVGLCV
jgi:hypothetical protein